MNGTTESSHLDSFSVIGYRRPRSREGKIFRLFLGKVAPLG